MRVPYKWLSEYVDTGVAAEKLAELLTLAGVEVGAVEPFGPALPGIVVGQVKTLKPHPGKSNLTLVETDVGDSVLKIVCGAKNMQVGDRVPVACPGAVLPGERLIEEAVLHGSRSEGMICSAQELGLDLGAEDEILILDKSAPIGAAVDKVLGFDEPILDLELTPNRADCLSLLGVAHEVAALTGGTVKMPSLEPVEKGPDIDTVIAVAVEDTSLCPRYTARAVREVKIGPSPLWMQLRLLKAGIRPINNVVDITNYVMWEFGQPLHAFDLDLLAGKQILVRRANAGEKLVTLDGLERTLDPEALVIADSASPVGLAGVMGGENTEITVKTRQVLIEAAVFNPANIRRTARRFNLPSEASQRFERGVNPEAVAWSQERAARLMSELAGGKVLNGMIDCRAVEDIPARIKVSPQRISQILGLKIAENEVIAILTRLGCAIEKDDHEQALEVTVPLRRADIRLEEDIVEEVARIHGYDKIPVSLPRGKMLQNRPSAAERLQDLIRDILTACGYYECINYSFINPSGLSRLRLPRGDRRLQAIPVQNPFSEEQAIMRTTLLPGLLRTVQYNYKYRELNQLFFEMGKVYEPLELPLTRFPAENFSLGLAATGSIPGPNWIVSPKDADFFTIKGALEILFAGLQIESVSFVPAAPPFAHPTRAALILIDGREAGFLGQLHPEVAAEWEIDQPVTVCEISLELVAEKADPLPRVAPLPRYPAAGRDLAVVVPAEIPAEQLEKAIREAGGSMVRKVNLFDLYVGPQIPAGKRSLAYSITFRSEEGTLTDAAVNRSLEDIEKALLALGAVLRR